MKSVKMEGAGKETMRNGPLLASLSIRHPHIYNLHTSEPIEIPHLDRRMQLLVVSISVVALVTIRFDS